MKFEKIEPINKIENNLWVRHKVEDMRGNELIQKCLRCGEVLDDYTIRGLHKPPLKNGSPSGYVYLNKSGNSTIKISGYAIEVGIFKEPTSFIDCTIINS